MVEGFLVKVHFLDMGGDFQKISHNPLKNRKSQDPSKKIKILPTPFYQRSRPLFDFYFSPPLFPGSTFVSIFKNQEKIMIKGVFYQSHFYSKLRKPQSTLLTNPHTHSPLLLTLPIPTPHHLHTHSNS